jgi:carbamoyl-phosphate synthase small subunit
MIGEKTDNERVARLALEDGAVFSGRAFGGAGTAVAEVVFNTAMVGYQEVLTDPSYCGQIVSMTFPQIGNCGVNPDDAESAVPRPAGFVVRDLPKRPSNYRATGSLGELLREHGIIGLAGVDTRALARRVRIHGALRGVLSTEIEDELELVRRANGAALMEGANLVQTVMPTASRTWDEPLWRFEPGETSAAGGGHVVSLDCGIKRNILRHLAESGCRVSVLPADAPADAIRGLKPDALLVGNGPGDPAAVTGTIDTLRGLVGELPIFGICLGHQLLALALGADTYKLRFGHHGANHPVRNLLTGRIETTSQNHGFAVDTPSLERCGARPTHINANDKSLEGFCHADKQLAAVQFHPEAAPGPHDAAYLFGRFVDGLRNGRPIETMFQSVP